MARLVWTGFALLALGVPANLVHAHEAQGAGRQNDVRQGTVASSASPDRSLARQFAEIRAEYDQLQLAHSQARTNVSGQSKASPIPAEVRPDDFIFSRRMIELALTAPAEPAARDALVWVINKPYRSDQGLYGDEFGRAAALLVRHHGNDPEAIRAGLVLEHVHTFHRDQLLLGFYAAAKDREAKGLARLALAQYLEGKARYALRARETQGRPKMRRPGPADASGKRQEMMVDRSDEDYAYSLHARQCDPEALRAEAERLYNEVSTEYADVPLITFRQRELAALLDDPMPTRRGQPLSAEDRRRIEQILARKKTLGDAARARLDEMHNLVAGKPAPEIDGVDMAGKPFKLSSYRGKVVLLVFWGSWCGPCMAEVPHERELAERLKDRPFVLLGVDCDIDKAAALKAIETNKMTWPNWYDGAPGDGPIVKRYQVRGYPTVFLIDAQGIIRHTRFPNSQLDKAVDDLITEAASNGSRTAH
jgi:thiol-disulfide isomerase/thioredoxin